MHASVVGQNANVEHQAQAVLNRLGVRGSLDLFAKAQKQRKAQEMRVQHISSTKNISFTKKSKVAMFFVFTHIPLGSKLLNSGLV